VGSGLNGSLRYAITNAANGDTITFGTGVTGIINLTGALPDLTHSVSIQGPGANSLTLRRNTGGNYRIFTVAAGATVTISGLTISNGYLTGDADDGGGILNSGMLTVSACTITGNTVASAGGGIANYGTLLLSSSAITANNSSSGGGISAMGGSGVTVTDRTVAGNNARLGGGISNDNGASFSVSNSTISGNYAQRTGGGIFNNRMLTVSNSTVSGNTADGDQGGTGGGGIFTNYGTLTLTNCTIAGNSAIQFNGSGGGIYVAYSAVSLRNTIIAGNAVRAAYDGPDVYGGVSSQGHNLIGNDSGASGFIATDLLNVNPLLGPLQGNGGATLTRALMAGSPALNAGDSAQLGVADQRGVVRSGGVNIGAHQASASALVLTAPATVTAGAPFVITVKAVDPFAQTAVGYGGTVHFVASNGAMANYTFTATDGGQHTFGDLVLRRTSTLTVTGTDMANPAIMGSLTFTVTAAAPAYLSFNVPSSITAGVPFSITVTVQDAYGNTVSGYQGTVHLAAYLGTDLIATADYTFNGADSGQHTFTGIMLYQPGDGTGASVSTCCSVATTVSPRKGGRPVSSS
jgi:hypothetical protein